MVTRFVHSFAPCTLIAHGGTAKGFAVTDTPVGMELFAVRSRCVLCTAMFCMLCFNAIFFVRATTFHIHSGSYMLLYQKATKQGWGQAVC